MRQNLEHLRLFAKRLSVCHILNNIADLAILSLIQKRHSDRDHAREKTCIAALAWHFFAPVSVPN
jgi:hypothetical protein